MSAMRVLRAGSVSRPSSLWRPTKCAWMFGRRPGAPCSDTANTSVPWEESLQDTTRLYPSPGDRGGAPSADALGNVDVSPSSRASRPSTSARCAESGCQREPARRTAQDLHRAAAVDRRRDLLPADRSHFPETSIPTNKYESGALSALFAIGQWRVSSRLYCRQTEEWWGLTGPKGRHEPTRTHHHWGATPRQLTFGGRQLSLSCPRVRSREGQEAALPSVRAFREQSPP